MKTYHVTVNGTTYEVQVSEAPENAPAAAPAPAVVPAPVAAPAPAATPAPAAKGEGEEVTSPMPGTILSVSAAVGQSVKSGDVLMILEAMKMENEIMAPRDGVITAVAVNAGQTVESGSSLYTIA